MPTSMSCCPECRHTVPQGRWCNRCGTPLGDLAAPEAAWARGRRVPTALGAAAVAGVLVWGGAQSGQPQATSPQEVDSAVALADDARTGPWPTPRRSDPPVPPEPRTDVVCSDLRPRSVPTADLDTDVPGELVQFGGRTCVVRRPEGVTVP